MPARRSVRRKQTGNGDDTAAEAAVSEPLLPAQNGDAALDKTYVSKRDGKKDTKANGSSSADAEKHAEKHAELSASDVRAVALLVVLYFLQGIPVGLAFGTMPFLLKARLSYSDIGIFSLATYPYSLKLLWSPIVDSCYVKEWRLPIIGYTLSLGRRKSWIVPVQAIVGILFYLISANADALLLADTPNVYLITSLFFTLVMFAATQDIAVDGWALELLSEANLSYASTAQTVGLNTGYFLSFTVFLAFNSVEFCNKYLRSSPLPDPVLTLAGYLRLSAFALFGVTAWLLLFQKEEQAPASGKGDGGKDEVEEMGVRKVYGVMMEICKLKHVQTFILIHLVAKIGFQANDAVTGLKLVEKGFGKEDLALTVLIDFPFQIILGYFAARWSKGDNALRPWLVGYVARLGFALASIAIVAGFPEPTESGHKSQIPMSYFLLIAITTITASFASTVQFVGISAFHTQIADPLIGGTYMTLLNTVSNLGGTWPRPLVLKGVDFFTKSRCSAPLAGKVSQALGTTASMPDCHSDAGKTACDALGGTCIIERDGYYWTSGICVAVGVLVLLTFILPKSRQLQALPAGAWRVSMDKRKA